MDPTIKTKWLAALRSGDYLQGQSALNRGNHFCCLGVLCDIVDPDAWDGELHKGCGFSPAGDLQDSVGLSDYTVGHLIELNDNLKLSFPQIADYIETNL